jgi:hypothetical protein
MNLEDGLNTGMVKKICASTFRNEIAHMTLEISNPKVLEVLRDIKVTFPDMLGTVGKVTNKQLSSPMNLHIFRWNNWPVHWTKPHQHCRNALLGL